MYRGSAPIFITAKEKGLALLEDEAERAMRENTASEATMLLRRLRLYRFTQRMPKPPVALKPCGCCFAKFVLHFEALWQQRQAQMGPWGAVA